MEAGIERKFVINLLETTDSHRHREIDLNTWRLSFVYVNICLVIFGSNVSCIVVVAAVQSVNITPTLTARTLQSATARSVPRTCRPSHRRLPLPNARRFVSVMMILIMVMIQSVIKFRCTFEQCWNLYFLKLCCVYGKTCYRSCVTVTVTVTKVFILRFLLKDRKCIAESFTYIQRSPG